MKKLKNCTLFFSVNDNLQISLDTPVILRKNDRMSGGVVGTTLICTHDAIFRNSSANNASAQFNCTPSFNQIARFIGVKMLR